MGSTQVYRSHILIWSGPTHVSHGLWLIGLVAKGPWQAPHKPPAKGRWPSPQVLTQQELEIMTPHKSRVSAPPNHQLGLCKKQMHFWAPTSCVPVSPLPCAQLAQHPITFYPLCSRTPSTGSFTSNFLCWGAPSFSTTPTSPFPSGDTAQGADPVFT